MFILVDPPVPLWWGLPPIITLALVVAVAVALALKVSESPLIGPGGQPLSLWSCSFDNNKIHKRMNKTRGSEFDPLDQSEEMQILSVPVPVLVPE